MDFTTRQLEQFVVVAEQEHLGRAAELLSMSQPPLTQAMHRLERSVGVPLLTRTGRNVRLTPAGRSFAADAASLLADQQAAVNRARRVADGTLGTVRIGYLGSLAFGFVPDLLRACAAALPDVTVELVQQPSTALRAALTGGRIDIAALRASSIPDADFEVRLIREEQLVVAVPTGHPLAEHDHLTMAELADEPFVSLGSPGSVELGDALRVAAAGAGFAPRVVAEAIDLPGMLAWVIAGRALALVPGDASGIASPHVSLVPFDRPAPERAIRFVAVARPHRDPAVDSILELMSRR